MSRPALRHGAEELGVRTLAAASRWLPERAASAAGAAAGWTAGSLLRIRRRDVDRHLALAFPDAPPARRRRIARASFAHLGREATALLRLAGTDARGLRLRTEVAGLRSLEDAVGAGRGAVVVTGHLGNWEVGGAALAARGVPLDVVAKGMANPRVAARLTAVRGRLGMRVIDAAAAAREVPRSLAAGRVVALVADQNAHRGGVFVPFFGVDAATHRGPAAFAVGCAVPLFVGVALRERKAPAGYRVTLERVEVAREGHPEADALRLTRAYTGVLERAVRACPEQYFWQHRRWKTRPTPEPAPSSPV